jgi:hypothetical protein
LATRKVAKQSWFDRALGVEPPDPPIKKNDEKVALEPALRQIGTTHCPVCKQRVAVYLTKTNRPFINCGFCSARIFCNGREAMRRLKRKMKLVEE